MARQSDYYKVLDVPKNATEAEIYDAASNILQQRLSQIRGVGDASPQQALRQRRAEVAREDGQDLDAHGLQSSNRPSGGAITIRRPGSSTYGSSGFNFPSIG